MENRVKALGLQAVVLLSLCLFFTVQQIQPTKAAYVASSFACNATKAGANSYWGEKDQLVTFTATFSGPMSDARLNMSYNGGGWDWSTGATFVSGATSYVTITHTLLNPLPSGNSTASFKIVVNDGGWTETAETFTFNIAQAEVPANATDFAASAQPGGKVAMSWRNGVNAQGKHDNAELGNFLVYRSTMKYLNTKEDIEGLTPIAVLSRDTFQYTDSATEDKTTYYYTVVARDLARHESVPATSKKATADASKPVITKFLANGTEYNATNPQVIAFPNSVVHFRFDINEPTVSGLLILNQSSGKDQLLIQYSLFYNETAMYYYFDLYTNPVGAEALPKGTYTVILNITDHAGNVLSQVEANRLLITDPPDPTLVFVFITLAIAAGGVAAGYVALVQIKKRKSRASAEQKQTSAAKKRKGEVFKGASALGRASGDEAEEILTKRKKSGGTPASAAKIREDSSTKSRGPSPARVESALIASAAPAARLEDFGPLGEGKSVSKQQMRTLEKSSTIDQSKKVDFITSRVNEVDRVLGVVANLVSLIPEPTACEKCGNPLGTGWAKCPWCVVNQKADELELTLSIVAADAKKMDICPKCRAPQHSSWSKCPYCQIQQHP